MKTDVLLEFYNKFLTVILRLFRCNARLNKYIKTLGPIYGRLIYLIEVLGYNKPLSIRCNSIKLLLRPRTTDIKVLNSVMINQEYNICQLDNPLFIIDAGAYTGFSSIYFANRYPEAIIIAIEPVPANYQLLVKNTAQYPQIITIEKALWFEHKKLAIIDENQGHWGYRVINQQGSESTNIVNHVDTIMLDDILRDYSITAVDLLKLDIEGAEKDIFENSNSWINSINAIAIELHDNLRKDCSKVFFKATKDFYIESKYMDTIYLIRKHIELY